MLTQIQIENTKMAYAIMAGIPAERINLDALRKFDDYGSSFVAVSDTGLKNECGSVGCIAGWLSAHPYFKKQGLRYMGGSLVYGVNSVNTVDSLFFSARELFGKSSMFESSKKLGMAHAGIDQKREALARLRVHLFDNDAITWDRNNKLIVEEGAMTS